MTVFKRFSPNVSAAFWAVTMIALWLAFAPAKAGGAASYIIVIGNSMEPEFHIGDLVIARETATYQVGDAVAYRNAELESYVFHRIVSSASGRYLLKGDNNAWTDTYQPTGDEVIGKSWLLIPKGGIIIQKMRAPASMAVLAGLLGWFIVASLWTSKRKGNNRMKNRSIREWFVSIKQKTRIWLAQRKGFSGDKPSGLLQGGMLEASFFALGFIAIASVVLGIIAFSRPTTRLAQDEISYEHLGVFSYSAAAPQGVYDSNTIKSGDPIFPRLTCSVDVTFHYTLIAGQTGNITGKYQMTAIISEEVSGWRRTVPLQEPASFTGTTFGTTARLDLCKLESLTQSLEQGTEFHPGAYTLTIVPNIEVDGIVSDRALNSAFNQGLTFRYDRIHFYLVSEEEQDNPLVVSETGMLSEEYEEANTMSLLGAQVAVSALRMMSVLGLVVSLVALAMLGLKLQVYSKTNQAMLARMKYASMMIDVQNAASFQGAGLIEVKSMDDLAKLAERFNTVILHEERGNSHAYYLQGEGSAYRFVLADEAGSAVPVEEANDLGGEA